MSNNPLACIILAAGQGTRMKSSEPKVMHELAGQPMINWLLGTVEQLEPEKIIVVTAPDMLPLEQAVQPHQIAIQPEQNGTAGAVKAALPALGEFEGDVLILVGDMPLISAETLRSLIATRGKAGLSVLGVKLPDPTGYGRLIVDKKGVVQKIVEEKDASSEEKAVQLINTGAFCVDGARLPGWLEQVGNDNAQSEYYITDLPEVAARDDAKTNVFTTMNTAEVQGCNSRSELAMLEQTAQDTLRKRIMDRGVTMLDPSSVYLQYDTEIAPGVLIEPHVFFGPGVEIAEGVHIKAFSHIEGAKIEKSVSVGPFARLRPGSEIGAETRIGNFVEIKKSQIGPRSKINHLAYVGDTIMGDDTNFSAGAITVNYDGFQKHQTVIGKGVMVGSNVNLVAPLQIDDGAFIAAGSTITEDVPADALSIARDVSKIREGWAAEYRRRKKIIAEKIRKKKQAG